MRAAAQRRHEGFARLTPAPAPPPVVRLAGNRFRVVPNRPNLGVGSLQRRGCERTEHQTKLGNTASSSCAMKPNFRYLALDRHTSLHSKTPRWTCDEVSSWCWGTWLPVPASVGRRLAAARLNSSCPSATSATPQNLYCLPLVIRPFWITSAQAFETTGPTL